MTINDHFDQNLNTHENPPYCVWVTLNKRIATSQAGLIDDDGQPTVSRPEAALMANMLAYRLNITNKWKMFEALWHRNNMRGDYNTAMEQKKSLEFQDRLKNIFDWFLAV